MQYSLFHCTRFLVIFSFFGIIRKLLELPVIADLSTTYSSPSSRKNDYTILVITLLESTNTSDRLFLIVHDVSHAFELVMNELYSQLYIHHLFYSAERSRCFVLVFKKIDFKPVVSV